jgi:hypothetical protein
MTKEEQAQVTHLKLELSKLVYILNNAGEYNSMIREYFNTSPLNSKELKLKDKKNWRKFIQYYSDLLNTVI